MRQSQFCRHNGKTWDGNVNVMTNVPKKCIFICDYVLDNVKLNFPLIIEKCCSCREHGPG